MTTTDDTTSTNKDITSPNYDNIIKKMHRIAGTNFVVIDKSLVCRLGLDEDSWFEQKLSENGIFLNIIRDRLRYIKSLP